MSAITSIKLGRTHDQGNNRCLRREPVRPLLSLTRELGFVVLLCQLLLPYIHPVLGWVPLLEEGGELHCVITGMNTLNSTIQSPIAGEEIGEGALYWVEGSTLLVDLALTLLCIPTEGAGKSPTHSIPELFLFAVKQR